VDFYLQSPELQFKLPYDNSNLFSQPGGMPTQSRSFSKNSKEGRGDTSVWTDNPLDRAQKAKMKYDYCLLVIVNIHLF
jgi:hypothetical protein